MLTLEKIKQFCEDHKIPAFRAKQIFHAIYQEGVESFRDITTLPAEMREKLEAERDGELKISTVKPTAQEVSADGSTVKMLFELPDGNTIEGVLMRFNDGRRTVCISSEVGCPLKCKFCASGTLRFKRSLTWEEMADQVIYFSRYLKRQTALALKAIPKSTPKSSPKPAPEELNHVVYMGIGEPFRNYDNLMKSLAILMDPQYVGLGARKITVSTAGVVERIRQFADEPFQVNLALSLHAPTQELRQQIMPIAIKYKLDDLMDAIRYYIDKTKRRISFEYVMLRGINDTEECAHQLAKLVKGMLCHVNLIPYNATDIPDITGSERASIKKFQEILNDAGVPATTRVSLGQDIAAACGQLANKAQKPVEAVKARVIGAAEAMSMARPATKKSAMSKPVAKKSVVSKLSGGAVRRAKK